jgi:hypothetical protein
MDSLIRARTFLLASYHDLPNVLFIGSLVLGAVMGYLPLVWVAVGLILTGAIVTLGQGLLSFVTPTWSQVVLPANRIACEIFGRATLPSRGDVTVVAPSYWLAAAVFFGTFSVYNSIRVALRAPTSAAAASKVDNRRAFSLSTLVIGMVFLALVFARGFTGCETWLGSTTGAAIGAGVAIGFWHLLDACGTGVVPDILQVMNSLAPEGDDTVPVVCKAD